MTDLLNARLWSRIRPLENGCWECSGTRNEKGYALVQVAGKRNRRVHRVVYELLIGPISPGLVPDHTCWNPWCANPLHLEPVTNRENTLRGISPNAANARKTHCKNGHEFTEENAFRRTDRPGRRECRICRKAIFARRHERLKRVA
jgi:hypothetical protein